MISGVTAEVSCVLSVAPATLTPITAVPPRLGVACALAPPAQPTPNAARHAAAASGPRVRLKISFIAMLLARRVWVCGEILPRRQPPRPWPACVHGRDGDQRPAWRPEGTACNHSPDCRAPGASGRPRRPCRDT